MDGEPRRIVIIKPSALGDIMHSLPVLAALRRRFPAADIGWVVNRTYESLLAEHPDLDEVIPFDRNLTRRGVVNGVVGGARFFRELRQKRFDLAIDLQGLLRTGLMTLATGATRRIGLASAREGARWFYNDVVDDGSKPHAVDRYWRVIEHLGADPCSKSFHVPVNETARTWAGELLAAYPRPWLAVGVGARWLTKRWPPEHFAAVADQATRAFGGTVVLVGAPDEAELSARTAALLACPKVDLAGKTTLPQLVAILSLCDIMLANDTGPLHLAVALGLPVVAPYTCTKVNRTGPYRQDAHAIESRIWCQGSYLKKCDRLECMAELTPERVWPVLCGILETWARRSA